MFCCRYIIVNTRIKMMMMMMMMDGDDDDDDDNVDNGYNCVLDLL